MKNKVLLLIVSLIFVSCSSGKLVISIPMEPSIEAEINEKGKNNIAKIKLIDERVIFAKDLFVKADSVRYCNLEDSSISVISLGLVKEIRFKHHLAGSALGMATGGYLLGVIGYKWENENHQSGYGKIIMIGGAIWGTIIGGTLGIHRYYEFETNKEISKNQ